MEAIQLEIEIALLRNEMLRRQVILEKNRDALNEFKYGKIDLSKLHGKIFFANGSNLFLKVDSKRTEGILMKNQVRIHSKMKTDTSILETMEARFQELANVSEEL